MKKTEAMKFRNLSILFVLIIFFIITFTIYSLSKIPTKNSEPIAFVTKVIDGDTFELESGEIVRLLCINAPEKDEPGFNESKNYLEYLILNKNVILEKDSINKDKFDRLLRYVYVNITRQTCEFNNDPNELSDSVCDIEFEKQVLVNKELVKNNHAKIENYQEDLDKCNAILS